MTNVSQAIQVARQAYIKVQWNTNLWVLCRDGTMLCYIEWCIMFQLHINTTIEMLMHQCVDKSNVCACV